MATAYKFVAPEKAVTIKFTNTYGTDEYKDYAIDDTNLSMLEDLEGVQMATGFASLGTPHIDEYDEYGKVIVAEKNGFKEAHAFALRLFGSDINGGANQYITLFPGDSLEISAAGNAALYYAAIRADGIKVEAEGVIDPMPYVPEKVKVFDTTAETYLDRGTGVGDESAIDFDSEAYTEEMEEAISA